MSKALLEQLTQKNRELTAQVEELILANGELQKKDKALMRNPPSYARRWEACMKVLQVTKLENADASFGLMQNIYDFTAKGLEPEILEAEEQNYN